MKNLLFLSLVLFLFIGCSKQFETNYNVSNNTTFEEFKLKLDEYAKNNPYPNIDD